MPFACAFAAAPPAKNQNTAEAKSTSGLQIAAVVNSDVISTYDLDNRLRFALATTKIVPTPELLPRIRAQIMRSMIDERLQEQEAKRLDITLTDSDIDNAIKSIEEQRGIEEGGIEKLLRANHISPDTFRKQVHAQLGWNHIIGAKVRSKIKISDEDIALTTQKMAVVPKKFEYQISILNIPVDKPSREKDVYTVASKLVHDLREGSSFDEISRQFSGSSPREGGKASVIWVRLQELDPQVAQALSKAKAGSVTDPIRNQLGFTVIKVIDTRDIPSEVPLDTAISFKEILLKLKETATQKEADLLVEIAKQVTQNPGSCADKGVANIKGLEDVDISAEFKDYRLSELSPALKIIAENLKPGDISEPLASSEGIRLYMLCGKKEGVSLPPNREKVVAAIFEQRVELEAQKYMRNLRQDAFIDIR